MTHYYEELAPGVVVETASRTIGDDDIAAFAELSGDRNPLHLDDAAARRAGFEGRVAHGVLGIAVATGLLSATRLTRESLIALLGVSWRFVAPVRSGDVVRVRARVSARRESATPGRGVVTFAVELLDAGDRVLQSGELVELVRRRDAPSG